MTDLCQGRKNIYVCDQCFGHVVTVDLDAGVTPFMIGCYATTGCKGMMKSSFYRVFDQTIAASHEWYRPSEAEVDCLSLNGKDHVEHGGLLLRLIVLQASTVKNHVEKGGLLLRPIGEKNDP